jgi:hypothetical protein
MSALLCHRVSDFRKVPMETGFWGRCAAEFPYCVPRTRERRSREPVKTFSISLCGFGRQRAQWFHRNWPRSWGESARGLQAGYPGPVRIDGNRVSAPVTRFLEMREGSGAHQHRVWREWARCAFKSVCGAALRTSTRRNGAPTQRCAPQF